MKIIFLILLSLTLGACGGGGGGGAFGPLLSPAQQANIATASSAGLTATQTQTANTSISSAVTNLYSLISSNSLLSSNTSVAASALAAQSAVGLAAAAQSNAAAAAAELSIASNVSIVGVMSAGRSICAAANSCTAAEISRLSYRAAETAKNAAEASLFAITATNQLKQVMISVVPSLNVLTATTAITAAQTSAASAQATANQVISSHTTAAQNIGVTVPTISPSIGTTGSVAGTPTYSGNTQTIVTTFANGQTSTANNTATGTAVTWGSDNVTRTTTYTFANGGTNAVVATVPGTAGTPTYSGNTQTIVTTFANGQTSTANNQPTSSPVTWASDNVTRTTTHTFANGGTNAVVDTVPGVVGAPTYSGNTQTIVTTFGNGQTSTANNQPTSSPVTWASDNVTRTTTHTFANGGTNAVVDTVPGTETGGASTTINGIVSISPITMQYGSGVSIITQDGTSSKPFVQSSLIPKGIADSNSFIQSSTNTYDLRWGVKASPFAMSTSNNVSVQTSSTIGLISLNGIYFGDYGILPLNESFSITSLLSRSTDSLQGTWITQDVKNAWFDGWSGKGVRIGVIDDFTANDKSDYLRIPLSTGCDTRYVLSTPISTCSSSNALMIQATHGEQVAMIAGSSVANLTGFIAESGGWSDGVDLGSYNLVKDLNINFSRPFYGVAKDASIYRDDFLTYQSNTLGLFSVLKDWGVGSNSASSLYRSLHVLNMSLGGTSKNTVSNQAVYSQQLSYANTSLVPDIVFVKAAGNSSCIVNQTNCDPLNAVLFNSPNYKNKSIIVGALNEAGGTIASYSNKAGSYSEIFLVADGRGLYNSASDAYIEGTSFAAPRVAGYAAILRHKFPNLNAEKSVSIMLDTARNDTLACFPNCNSAIYGKGEASLSRALAPVGRLR